MGVDGVDGLCPPPRGICFKRGRTAPILGKRWGGLRCKQVVVKQELETTRGEAVVTRELGTAQKPSIGMEEPDRLASLQSNVTR